MDISFCAPVIHGNTFNVQLDAQLLIVDILLLWLSENLGSRRLTD